MARPNPLLRSFPTRVRLDGAEYPLGWRFTDCIPVILAYEDESLTAPEQQEILYRRLFPKPPPEHLRAPALLLAIRFLDGGVSEQDEQEAEEPEEDNLRLYSFTKDGGLIYSAFRGQYGIDLRQDELHWWAFLSLLTDLAPDCQFYQMLHLREGWLNGTLSREEEQLFARMGSQALPPPQPGDREREENARHFLDLLEGGVAHAIH